MPLDPKLQKFSTTSQTLVNLSFIEFASGTGYVTFNPAINNNKFLTENTSVFSETLNTDAIASAGNLDFEVTFNKAVIIEGKAIIKVPTSCFNNGSDTTVNIQVQPIIFKNTTAIGTGTNNNFTTPTITAGNIFDKMMGFDLEIPRTHFAIGDTLKLRLTITSTTSGSRSALVGHDPADRTGTTQFQDFGQRSEFLIPFRTT